ncbi:MAG TPA: group II intron reverse transcriptase/maturase [Chitinophagaceae bacterium]|nr:group II intron reverse transcriptase/maturase [Chitinophagaceae bacterium]
MLEEILDMRNVQKAFKQVTANKGAGGIDGMQTDELRDYLNANWQTLRNNILEGNYCPQAVRKVEISKEQGGTRMLGIPTVTDRLLQQAIAQWLSPKWEEEFSNYSYGFREGRSAHQAVMQGQTNLNEGYEWVIELDLEKFFDRVNHDKLMGLLAKKITDKRTLKLLRSYLNSGIMEDGMVIPRTEGTPQGSPLSPLMSNIVLNELDKELQARGHRYVRYADDCSIYVRSEKSAGRVLETITDYIEGKLKLKVNRNKSKVSRPTESTLLGFSFYRSEKGWEIRIAPKSLKRIKKKMKEQTRRKDPGTLKGKLKKMEAIIRGWVNYFSIAKAKSKMKELDELVRTRLRMGMWKQWKNPKTRIINLQRLGINRQKSYEWGNSRKGCCRVAHSAILCRALNNDYFTRQRYIGFANYYFWKTEHQTKLF